MTCWNHSMEQPVMNLEEFVMRIRLWFEKRGKPCRNTRRFQRGFTRIFFTRNCFIRYLFKTP